MTKFNCFLITVFFILSSVKLGYCDNEQNCFQVIKNIPVSYGKIFETNIINEEKPDIIIINDLHSNSFVQKNIYSIIKYIKSETDIDKIFVEGAQKGKIDTSAITNINKETKEKFLNKMLDKGLVSGAEYFCYTTNTDLYGTEDSALYTKTLQQAYILMRNENFFTVRLEKANKELNKAKKKFYSKDMFEFEYLFFNRTNIEAEKYCEQLQNVIKKYSIDINKYSEIYNFINIINCDKKLEPYKKNFLKDFSFLVQKIKNYAPFNVYEKFVKECKENNIEDNLIYCYKLTNNFLSQKEQDYFSYIDILLQKHNFVNIFDISKYLDEEEKVYAEIFNKIFQTEEIKEFAFINQMIYLTDKYTKLNIDFYNFEKFTISKNKFIEILNKTNYIKNKNEIIDILNNEELAVYYENNIKRDNIFFNNIKDLMTENSTNILVVGGFHKELLNLFNNDNKKYVVIFPNTNGNDDNIYRQLILDIGNYNFTTK
jgi:hypothetical protein